MNQKQRSIVRQLIAEYGVPDKILVSDGWDNIVRLDWCGQKRHLFIDKDGVRVVWTEDTL